MVGLDDNVGNIWLYAWDDPNLDKGLALLDLVPKRMVSCLEFVHLIIIHHLGVKLDHIFQYRLVGYFLEEVIAWADLDKS